MSKADRRRKKRRTRAVVFPKGVGARNRAKAVSAHVAGQDGPIAERPTPEREKRGVWAELEGMGAKRAAVVDLQEDIIGRLNLRHAITDAQRDAARAFQEIHAAWLAELQVTGYKSCIASVMEAARGHDNGDGNEAAIRRYLSIDAKLSHPQRQAVHWVCIAGRDPYNLALLRDALDVVAAVVQRF